MYNKLLNVIGVHVHLHLQEYKCNVFVFVCESVCIMYNKLWNIIGVHMHCICKNTRVLCLCVKMYTYFTIIYGML